MLETAFITVVWNHLTLKCLSDIGPWVVKLYEFYVFLKFIAVGISLDSSYFCNTNKTKLNYNLILYT